MQPNKPFLSDIQQIRDRARRHMEKGAVTDAYKADLVTVLRLLNEALATEIVCVLRYKRHQFTAHGLSAQSVADEFKEHAAEEQQHADSIAQRIVELGGEPNFSPEGLSSRSHSEYVEGETLTDMIKEDLVAERVAIESYTEIIRFLGDNDSTSRRRWKRSWPKRKNTPKTCSRSSSESEKRGCSARALYCKPCSVPQILTAMPISANMAALAASARLAPSASGAVRHLDVIRLCFAIN